METRNEERKQDPVETGADLSGNIPVRIIDAPVLRHPFFLWGSVVVWAILILAATSTPGSQVPKIGIPNLDLVVHMGLYAVFGVLILRALYRGAGLKTVATAVIVTLTAAVVFGILDEIHQIWIPGRQCSVRDMAADSIGAVLGVAAYWKVRIRGRPPAEKAG